MTLKSLDPLMIDEMAKASVFFFQILACPLFENRPVFEDVNIIGSRHGA